MQKQSYYCKYNFGLCRGRRSWITNNEKSNLYFLVIIWGCLHYDIAAFPPSFFTVSRKEALLLYSSIKQSHESSLFCNFLLTPQPPRPRRSFSASSNQNSYSPRDPNKTQIDKKLLLPVSFSFFSFHGSTAAVYSTHLIWDVVHVDIPTAAVVVLVSSLPYRNRKRVSVDSVVSVFFQLFFSCVAEKKEGYKSRSYQQK